LDGQAATAFQPGSKVNVGREVQRQVLEGHMDRSAEHDAEVDACESGECDHDICAYHARLYAELQAEAAHADQAAFDGWF
jgi:hypothetical protein